MHITTIILPIKNTGEFKLRKVLFLFYSTFLMAGCWDQNQLKDDRLVNGISFDTADSSEDIKGTVRAINIRGSGGGRFEVKDDFYISEEETVAQLEMNLQNKVSGNMDLGKAFIIIIGEDLAQKKGINPLLEPIFRSLKGYISSRVVISEGKGSDILTLKIDESPIVFEVDNLLIGGAKNSYIPEETTFTVWNEILDDTNDIIIPYIKKDSQNKLRLAGSALFDRDKFTGYTLTTSQTSLLLLLRGEIQEVAKVTIDSEKLSQPLTLAIEDGKTKMDVKKEDGKVTCQITANLKAKILSYYEGKASEDIKHLNEVASEELTKKTQELTNILIKANSDALGVAKDFSTEYHESWNPDSWKDEYQHVDFKQKINVDIISSNNLQ